MSDSDIDDLLRRYRPVGPPPELRGRILATRRVERVWPWASAAAALLVSTLALHVAARDEATGVDLKLGPEAAVRVVDDLTDRLGGDEGARQLAEFILLEQQVRRETVETQPEVLREGAWR